MLPKRRLPLTPSWPERQLAWLERERSVALWMHRAAARLWVVRCMGAISRIGDGWIWYAVIAGVWVAGGEEGSSAATRMFGVAAFNLVIYWIVKRWIARPRPFHTCPGIRECARSLDEQRVEDLSAHAEASVTETAKAVTGHELAMNAVA